VSEEPSATGRFSATARPAWTRSPAARLGAVVAIVVIGLGLILGRIDIALLGLPIAIAIAVSLARRPSQQAPATATISVGDSARGEIDYTITITPPARTETVIVRHSILNGERREFAVSAREAADLPGTVPLLHSGPQEFVRVEYRLLGPDGLAASIAEDPLIAERVVASSEVGFDALPLPPRLQGLTGQHESARAGDGGEFRDVHPFTAGDRLRRIDWKATARRGQNPGDLYVRRTNALADATVLIVLDSRDDVGEQISEWSRNTASRKGLSSLDVAREAATSIATGYIRYGDRVGFQDLSSRARMVAHAGGTRHLWKLLRAIEVSAPSEIHFTHERAPVVPPGALVYLLSSLLDDRSVQLALRWRANGHRVIVVDVLPSPRFDRTTRYERIAHRLVMMEREDRIRILGARGVGMLAWRDETTTLPLRARLQLLSRPARAGAASGGGR
jgi:uncharacterized protein (DUF58 family)